jgi:zinc transporter ZupT
VAGCAEWNPAAQREGNVDFATMGTILGFTVMMFLDVALG